MKLCGCGIGKLHQKTYQDVYVYRGETYPITMYCSECDVCGMELSNREDSLLTDSEVLKIKAEVDKLLEYCQ